MRGTFDEAHASFINEHLTRRTGERKGRLLRGHNYAEKLLLQNVWWPVFGTFQDLHPEYEISDWNRKSQFLDFAYLPPFGKFGLECDGFQSHVRDMDRERFSYSLNRDTFLTGMGWKMIHFSFDDVLQRPEICRMLLQLVIGPHLLRNTSEQPLHVIEREILRLAWSLGRRVRPKDVTELLGIDFRTARNWLCGLVDKGMLQPVGNGEKIRSYEMLATAIVRLTE
ncbi:hypothetical protein V3851_17350 [Paenibacillus sp. M1]|uniref:DNA-binding response regulator n=1 Tax=Paenibacillus haidiansis TaxID=1574488 RepID=A0ABU7VV11_9BACL